MSDIDVTLICFIESDIPQVLESFYHLKKKFPILGEPEICTLQEWEDRNKFMSPIAEKVWSNIFQLRKISWQEKKLAESIDEYEITKTERGIARSKKKIRALGNTIFLDKLCPTEIPKSVTRKNTFPQFSDYLECVITHRLEVERNLFFDDFDRVEGFCQILPGHECYDDRIHCLQLRIFLIKSEILLSKSKLRILNLHRMEQKQADQLRGWISKLENSIHD